MEQTENDHLVKPSGTIVETLEWLADHGFPRCWYLHGRYGSAVIFQEGYHNTPRIAMQGDKLMFRQESETDRGYIVITQPEPIDAADGHVFQSSYTGMVCGQMIMRDGGGDECGLPYNDPIHHKDTTQTEAATSPANMIQSGGPSDLSPDAIDHATGDAAADEDGVPATDGPRIYVAGPMTGLPEFNYPAFRAAATALAELGWKVEDPSTNVLTIKNPAWADYMRVTIPQMLKCDAVATLEGWGKSKGACLEVDIADALDIPVRTIREWIKNGPAV